MALSLLTLPNCTLSHPALDRSNIVFCDITAPPTEPRCASATDIGMGLSLWSAATALYDSRHSMTGVDFLQAARDACSTHDPQALTFAGPFPDGTPVCVAAEAIGDGRRFRDIAAVCVDKCEQLFDHRTDPPYRAEALAYCADSRHAAASTNFPPAGTSTPSVAGGCTTGGMPLPGFSDPRRTPERITTWANVIGIDVDTDMDLIRSNIATPSDPLAFPAGADTALLIERGDAFLDFKATSPSGVTRLIGFSEHPPDTETRYDSITYGFDLFRDGCFYVFEGGIPVGGTMMDGCLSPHALGHYSTNQLFRIRITANNDRPGLARISYIVMDPTCTDARGCRQAEVASHEDAQYPFRVDSAFHDFGATIGGIRLVYIHGGGVR